MDSVGDLGSDDDHSGNNSARIGSFSRSRLLILCADSISKRFDGRTVLSSARLAVESGEVVGLLGRMGEGKSTLLKICAGVTDADTGFVEFAGTQYHRPRLSTLAAHGLYYIGETNNLIGAMTVRQHFDLIEKRFGSGDRGSALQLLQLEDFVDARADTLSGGETRRVELALAFVRRPSCLLADEPFKSVDPLICDLLGNALRQLANRGCGVVVTGHEVNAIKPFLDSVIWVTSGTTYSLGSTGSAWNHEVFRREYLGPTNG